MIKTENDYIKYLNDRYEKDEALERTIHIWRGSKLTSSQKHRAKSMINHGQLGRAIKLYEPNEFRLGYNEWKNKSK